MSGGYASFGLWDMKMAVLLFGSSIARKIAEVYLVFFITVIRVIMYQFINE